MIRSSYHKRFIPLLLAPGVNGRRLLLSIDQMSSSLVRKAYISKKFLIILSRNSHNFLERFPDTPRLPIYMLLKFSVRFQSISGIKRSANRSVAH